MKIELNEEEITKYLSDLLSARLGVTGKVKYRWVAKANAHSAELKDLRLEMFFTDE